MMRLQIDMSDRDAKRLDELVVRSESRSRREVVMSAMALLSWAISEVEKGNDFGSYDFSENRFVKLTMPVFEEVSSTRKPRRQSVVRHSASSDSGT